jgi:beta-galactosidase
VTAGGEIVADGELDPLDVPPHATAQIKLDVPELAALPGMEYFLDFQVFTRTDEKLVPAGHEVAWEQFQLPVTVGEKVAITEISELTVEESDKTIIVTGAEFELLFDKQRGQIDSFKYNNTELLTVGPVLNFWRPPTDNDYIDARGAKLWREQGLYQLSHQPQKVSVEKVNANSVCILCDEVLTDADGQRRFSARLEYTIWGTGDMTLRSQVKPDASVKVLPKAGFQLKLPRIFDEFTWLGNGPHETYPDRKASGRIGLYTAPVEELFHAYVKPQESGNHSDVRWAVVTGSENIGLFICGTDLLNVSVYPYDDIDIGKANHLNELNQADFLTLNLDWAQNGLGTATCGPGYRDEYVLISQPFDVQIRLRPFDFTKTSPLDLAVQQLPKFKER